MGMMMCKRFIPTLRRWLCCLPKPPWSDESEYGGEGEREPLTGNLPWKSEHCLELRICELESIIERLREEHPRSNEEYETLIDTLEGKNRLLRAAEARRKCIPQEEPYCAECASLKAQIEELEAEVKLSKKACQRNNDLYQRVKDDMYAERD